LEVLLWETLTPDYDRVDHKADIFFQKGKIVLDYIPDNLVVDSKIVMDDNVPEIFYLAPIDRGMKIAERFVDSSDCFSND
jgi:hypothetical protein